MVKLDSKEEISGCPDLWLGVGRVEGGMNGTQDMKLLYLILQWLTNVLITLSKLMEYKIKTVI